MYSKFQEKWVEPEHRWISVRNNGGKEGRKKKKKGKVRVGGFYRQKRKKETDYFLPRPPPVPLPLWRSVIGKMTFVIGGRDPTELVGDSTTPDVVSLVTVGVKIENLRTKTLLN